MKIEATPRTAWVTECPSCREPLDFQKDDHVLFPTKKSAERFAEVWMITDSRPLAEICGCHKKPETRKGIPVLIFVTIGAWSSLAAAFGAMFFPWWGHWISSACVGVVIGSAQCIVLINEHKVNRTLFTQ